MEDHTRSAEHTVRDIMRPPVFVTDSESLSAVLGRMVAEKRNSLTVVDAEGKLVGAVNALDIIKAAIPDYLESDQIAAHFANEGILREDAQRVKDTPVSEFMSTDIPTIGPDASVVEAAVMAANEGRGRITVVDDDRRPVGILTRTEIKRIIASYLDIPDCFS